MADVTLSAVRAGITRLRVKGGASPESLYDLANGYVTAARTIAPRPGSRVYESLPDGTIGLALFNGVFQVFSDRALPNIPEGFSLNVLSHPERDLDPAPELVRIWKAEPLMGGLYVVAEWSDDPSRAFHYWLLSVSAGTWQPNTIHMLNDYVTPTMPNGLTYTADRLHEPDPPWAAGEERTVGDIREPTVFNGYKYVVVETHGEPPRSGSAEPNWIAREGAVVVEESDVAPGAPPPQQPPPQQPPPGYGNPGGSVPPKDDPGSGGGGSWQVQ